MSFGDFPGQEDVVKLLQRSLERGRLGHAYLFIGTNLTELEAVARTLAKTINCMAPPKRTSKGDPLDSCDTCAICRKVSEDAHPDILWIRPESKSRVITIDQMRELMQTVHLKPTQAKWKVEVIVAADRLNVQAANAFLKTLEEPPQNSVLILLSTEPDRILETILSRCLRLNFAGEGLALREPAFQEWVRQWSETACAGQKSLLGRYQLLSTLLARLNAIREQITETLTKRSPLETHDDLDPKTRERLEDELTAAIEAEYRRQRAELLNGLQWWLRDVWLQTRQVKGVGATFPHLGTTVQQIAQRLTPGDALQNLYQIERLQRQLATNVQEALALEVSLLSLRL